MVPLLSSFYFGSVEHYKLLQQHGRAVIDIGEHYERQSYRTRTAIVGPNGPQDLHVPVVHDHGNKMPMLAVAISYAETWPAQHLHAIRSAYGNTPWFIHYIDDIEAVIGQRYEKLVDLHAATRSMALRWLGLEVDIMISNTYLEHADGYVDLRRSFHPKRALPVPIAPVGPYTQVFADRHGFVGRRSVIDLVCNLGPEAARTLQATE
ncbi:MAG: WbqC family protein [Flavobacteriales bacterium]|nr:WbqC family protein [Flavobacteriales bacterium]